MVHRFQKVWFGLLFSAVPTGRAAVDERITNNFSATIHRHIWAFNSEVTIINLRDHSMVTWIIIDEFSMVDIATTTFEKYSHSTQVIIVGD